MRSWVWAVAVGMLLPVLALAEEVVPDLGQLRGIERYEGPESGKVLLKQNGFAVVPRYYHRIFSLYSDTELPHYVTMDSVHHTYQVIFEDLLKELETALSEELGTLTRSLRDQFKADGDPVQVRAHAFFTVADALLSEEDSPGPAGAELALIRAAAGVAPSPLFGYAMDYTQFKPRGFYVETPELRRYFRVMSWYGLAAFRLENAAETETACLIAKTLSETPDARAGWEKIDGLYRYLVGPCDDLTPLDYAAAGPDGLTRLPDPRVNSMVLALQDPNDWVRHVKGMRFLGKRYIPDSELFTNTTDPKVPGRFLPSGLDVLAANGSAHAKELLAKHPGTTTADYAAGRAKSESTFSELRTQTPATQYGGVLRVLQTMTASPVPQAPAFVKTPAYTDKNCMSALAAWAGTRHTLLLHVKQSFCTAGGMSGGLSGLQGYVEPNRDFFQAMGVLSEGVIAKFTPFNLVSLPRLKQFHTLVGQLEQMVISELSGVPFTQEETETLLKYKGVLVSLQEPKATEVGDQAFAWMAIVADVHSDLLHEQCLEVGTGAAMPIYVAMEYQGQWYLLVGGVYSYYEFQQPIADRLTDEAWRERWYRGQVPPPPSWTASYLASGYDAQALIERVRKGERVEELLSVDDPAVDELLTKVLDPGSEFREAENFYWLMHCAGTRLGRKAVPALLKMIREGEAPSHSYRDAEHQKYFPEKERFLAFAVNAVRPMITPEDFPAIREILLGGEKERVKSVLYALPQAYPKETEEFMRAVLHETDKPETRHACLGWLGWAGSKENTPELIALWKAGDAATKWQVMSALLSIWRVEPEQSEANGRARVLSAADDRQIEAWKGDFLATVLGFLSDMDPQEVMDAQDAIRKEEQSYSPADKPKELWDRQSNIESMQQTMASCIRLTGEQKMTGAVPFIGRWWQIFTDRSEVCCAEALAKLGTDEAVDLLLAPLHQEERIPKHADIFQGLAVAKSPRTVPVLQHLLSDSRPMNGSVGRVQDCAAGALAAIYPKGPGFDANKEELERNARIVLWKAFLERGASEESLSDAEKGQALLRAAQEEEKDGLPLTALALCMEIRQLLATGKDASEELAEVERNIVRLGGEEARSIAVKLSSMKDTIERDLADFEKNPQLAAGEGRVNLNTYDILPAYLQPSLRQMKTSDSFRKAGSSITGAYLDPWGSPYFVTHPARDGTSWIEIYSWGPNRKDDGGQGDDILIQVPN